MEKIFKLKENGTNVKTEILAGLTTFMTMAYIIALNPNLLTGFDRGSQLHCLRHCNVCHGISCQQAICPGARHGA